MKTSALVLASAVSAVIGLAAIAESHAQPASKPSFQNEKCFGVARAGKNDCQTATSSCAGTSKRDGQGDAWLYVPAGSCAKLNGGSPSPKV